MARQPDERRGRQHLNRMAKSPLLDRLAVFMMAAVFCSAIAVLVHEFSNVSAREVVVCLAALPRHQVFAAVGLTTLSYLLLTGYDFLALRYVRQRLRFQDLLFASFTAFALSNNIGFQLLSGGSTRYRIYKSYGLGTIEIAAIVTFCTIAYALGVITVGGLLALFDPPDVAALLHLSQSVVVAGGLALLSVSVAYLALCAIWRKPVAFVGYRLRPPSLPLAIAQIALSSIDAVVAGTVIYVLLPEDLGLSYQSFLSIYLIAATASVLSLVPGGLGVFETAITMMTAPASKAAALSALLAYRMIYFIAPLLLALVGLAVHELRGRNKKEQPLISGF
jgi:uncharacterized membrane protein YbhN (UPF0104 family)